MNIKKMPEMERPYEKLLTRGAEQLSDAELLAIIVKTGTKEKASIELAYELMKDCHYQEMGLNFLKDVSVCDIQKIKGFGTIKAIQLKAVAEIARRMAKPNFVMNYSVRSPEEAASLLMEDMRYLKQEHFVTIMLDSKNVVMKVITNSVGGLNSNYIQLREIFREPIKNGASKIVIAHNHPSGNPYPSENDIKMTQKVNEAGLLMGIELLDHIIIGNGIFASMKKMKKF